ncbi:MAG: glycosyltransferase [Anaerolineae bacterium]|nr:glycosyltransferase [Anaerolineae bacterium]
MKILQVAPYFNAQMGGSPRIVYQLSKHLADHGHEVTVVASDYGDPASRFENNRFSVILFPLVWAQMGFYVTPQMSKWVRDHACEFDVIHMHEVRTFQNIVVRYAASQNRIPYVISAHGTLPVIIQRKLAKRVFDLLFGQCILDGSARMIAVSPLEVTQYTRVGIGPECILLVPNGLALNEFGNLPQRGTFRQKMQICETAKLVLFVGRLHHIKGIDILIDAVHRLQVNNDGTVLVIVGPDHGALSDLRKQASALGLHNRVIFAGPLYGTAKMAAYVDADVVASPGMYEIFGLVAFEALMCGTPVVVSEDTGAGALIREAQAGATVPYGDRDALTVALQSALDREDGISEQIARGQAYIRHHIDWQANAEILTSLYAEVVKGYGYARHC